METARRLLWGERKMRGSKFIGRGQKRILVGFIDQGSILVHVFEPLPRDEAFSGRLNGCAPGSKSSAHALMDCASKTRDVLNFPVYGSSRRRKP